MDSLRRVLDRNVAQWVDTDNPANDEMVVESRLRERGTDLNNFSRNYTTWQLILRTQQIERSEAPTSIAEAQQIIEASSLDQRQVLFNADHHQILGNFLQYRLYIGYRYLREVFLQDQHDRELSEECADKICAKLLQTSLPLKSPQISNPSGILYNSRV